mgnify:CR=1 FL=1
MPQRIEDMLAQPWMQTVLGLAVLAFVAWLAYLVTRRVLLRVIRAVTRRTVWTWDDALEAHGVFKRLAQMVPTLVLQFGIVLVPEIPDSIDTLIRNIALALTVLFALLAISAVLNALEALYQSSPQGQHRSIKGYVQLIKIFLFVIGAIVIIASLVNRSPMLLLSGLGAISAVLLLVFKDTILSLVASVQLASNDMLRVGDWISMPSANADGDVIDVALHTVKVQNWDKTISTIPTWRLISESFQNWRGMQDSGGRRIKRALHIDASRVGYLADADLERLTRSRLLDKYLAQKRTDIDQWNRELGEAGQVPINQRRLTNLGTFRAYAQAFIEVHPDIHPGMTRMVRVLDPTPQGIPVEIYCFTRTTAWLEYERIQGDIFDHLIAILPEFGLALYQQPAGSDFAGLVHNAASPTT